jgi:cytochrome c oxidase assembly factor CtaG
LPSPFLSSFITLHTFLTSFMYFFMILTPCELSGADRHSTAS